jgi:hypothetical protein
VALEILYNPLYKFPDPYQSIGTFLHEKFDSENWGADKVDNTVDAVMDGTDTSNSPTSDKTKIVKSTTDNGSNTVGDSASVGLAVQASILTTTLGIVSTGLESISVLPASTDPIYGENGIMHHIFRIVTGKTTK